MPRLNEVQPEEASGHVKQIYDAAENEFGSVPNLFKGLANSPVGLRAYTQLGKIIDTGDLSVTQQSIVRLVVSQFNGCDYCVGAHTMECREHGMTEAETLQIRRGESDDPERAALIDFTLCVVETKGFVDDEDLAAFRDAGYTDGNVVEVLTIIAQKTLSNYFNHVHGTELDFPAAPEL
ncbi:MAG: carboxymuconolactone decarboxylase family protein [Armatimonadota bacterium]